MSEKDKIIKGGDILSVLNKQDELLLTDEVIENTLEEYAEILEVEFSPLVYYVIGDLLDQLLAKAKQHYEQKEVICPFCSKMFLLKAGVKHNE